MMRRAPFFARDTRASTSLLLLALGLLTLVGACGDDGDGGDVSDLHEVDTLVDSGGSDSTQAEDTAASDTASDAADDAEDSALTEVSDAADLRDTDAPNPDDRDGDLVLDADDNCPDLPNSAQDDGDDDGLGDACDACPELYDPSDNPAACAAIAELEPNDDLSFDDAGALEIPFTIAGTIGEFTTVDDVDVVTFHAQAGQLLRLDIDARGSECFCAVDLVDMDTFAYLRLFFTPPGTLDFRELFVTRTGTYYLRVYDLLNYQVPPYNVGGETFTYRVSVYPVPPLVVDGGQFPVAYSGGNDHRVRFTRVDQPLDRIVRAEASAVPLVENSFHEPALILWDPVAEAVIAENTFADILDTGRVELMAPPAPSGTVWLVEDFHYTWQANTVTVVADLEEPLGELEPNDGVDDASPIALNAPARGVIDAVPGGDDDYFVFAAPAARRLRITVTSDGAMEPYLELGVDGGGYLDRQLWAEGSLLEYLTSTPRTFVLRVNDRRERMGQEVGGPTFGYTVLVESLDPTPSALGAPPATANGVFDPPGAHLLYSVALTAGQPQEVQLSGANLPAQPVLRVVDPADGRLLGETYGRSVAISSPTDTTVLIDLGVRDGVGGPAVDFALGVQALPVTPIALPHAETLTLAPGGVAYFAATVASDHLLVVQLGAKAFSTDIELLEADTFAPIAQLTYVDSLRWLNDGGSDRQVLVRVRNRSASTAGSVVVGLQAGAPTALAGRPTSDSGALAEPSTASLFWVDLAAGELLQATATPTGGVSFKPDLRLYRSDTFGLLARSEGIPLLYVASAAGRALLEVRDTAGGGGSGYEHDVRVETPVLPVLTYPLTLSGAFDATTPRLAYRVPLTAGRVFDLDLEKTAGNYVSELRLLDPVTGQSRASVFDVEGFGRYNVAATELILTLQDWSGRTDASFTFDLAVRELDPTVVSEVAGDNQTPATAQTVSATLPVRVTGTLSGETDVDVYAVELPAYTTLRAYTTWSGPGTTTFYTELWVEDPDGAQVANSVFDGEAGFSYVEIDTGATGPAVWHVGVKHWFGATNDAYSLVLVQ